MAASSFDHRCHVGILFPRLLRGIKHLLALCWCHVARVRITHLKPRLLLGGRFACSVAVRAWNINFMVVRPLPVCHALCLARTITAWAYLTLRHPSGGVLEGADQRNDVLIESFTRDEKPPAVIGNALPDALAPSRVDEQINHLCVQPLLAHGFEGEGASIPDILRCARATLHATRII